MRLFHTVFPKKKFITFAAATLVLSLLTVGIAMLTRPSVSYAAAECIPQDLHPETNIIYCGLKGATAADLIKQFQTFYNQNSDKAGDNTTHVHNGDLQAVYNYSGGSASLVNGMNTSNTFEAISHPDGTITLLSDGRVVGTNMQIAARWVKPGQPGFTHVVNDVYLHSYKTFFNDTSDSVLTLVHINPSTGMADFAVWEWCGNRVIFTPTPAPVHSLKCDRLDATEADLTSTNIVYNFVAYATGNNAPITSYVFDFGDNSSQTTITTNRGFTPTVPHIYALTDVAHTVTAKVTVNATGVTPQTCTHTVNIPAKPQAPTSSLACVQLTATPQDSAKTTYIFTVTAQPNNTTITSYKFDFGNGTTQTVPTSASSATSQTVTYQPGTTHTAQAWVIGPLGTFTSATCQQIITVPAVLAATTTVLPNTGTGSVIGLFGLTTVIGGLFHRLVLRRKFLA